MILKVCYNNSVINTTVYFVVFRAYYCRNNNWIYDKTKKWTITANTNSEYNYPIYFLSNAGNITVYGADIAINVHPVVYLKSSVKISSGIGSKSNPYILSES